MFHNGLGIKSSTLQQNLLMWPTLLIGQACWRQDGCFDLEWQHPEILSGLPEIPLWFLVVTSWWLTSKFSTFSWSVKFPDCWLTMVPCSSVGFQTIGKLSCWYGMRHHPAERWRCHQDAVLPMIELRYSSGFWFLAADCPINETIAGWRLCCSYSPIPSGCHGI